jgi:hypothetical protein
LEKHAVSISRAEVMIWDSEGLYRVVEGEVWRKGPVAMSEAELSWTNEETLSMHQ